MDAIYGQRPASNGREGGLDSATALLESMMEDDETSTHNVLQATEASVFSPSITSESPSYWTGKEVHRLLTLWAEKSIQEQLLRSPWRTASVYNKISSELVSQGFNKSPTSCREKIKKLKQRYYKIKNGDAGSVDWRKGKWFSIMDRVLDYQPITVVSDGNIVKSMQPDSTPKVEDSDKHFPADISLSSLKPDGQGGHQILIESTYSIVQAESYDTFPEKSQSSLTPDGQVGHKIENSDVMINSTLLLESTDFVLKEETYDTFPEKFQSSLTPDGQVCHKIENSDVMINSTLLLESTCSVQKEETYDECRANWSADEVYALVTSWSSMSVQEELLTSHRNTRVFSHLSSNLGALGFKKTTQQCREKIKKLKHEYRKIKSNTNNNWSNIRGRRWFDIMDAVLSQQTRTPVLLESTNRPWTEDSDKHFPADTSSSSVTPDGGRGHQVEKSAAMETSLLLSETTYSVVQEESNEESQSSLTLDGQGCHKLENSDVMINSALLSESTDSVLQVDTCETFIEKSQSSLTLDGQRGHQIEESNVVINSTLLSESTDSILQVEMYDKYQAIWSADEVHALVTSWSSTSVQEELLSSQRNTTVFAHLSSKLAALGFKKTTKQCREKIKKLKQDYKKIKNDTNKNLPNTCGRKWFAIMDAVLSQQTTPPVLLETTNRPGTEDSTRDKILDKPQSSLTPDSQVSHQIEKSMMNSTLLSESTDAILQVEMDDKYQSIWSTDEVHALVTSWSSTSVQKELLSTVRNTRVFARVSSNLAALGFKKTTKQCRDKLKKLKQDYKKIKNGTSKNFTNSHVRRWFDIMDAVLSQQTGTPVILESTNRPGTEDSGPQLPLPSLRLLAPPLRLMSAFMWQVAQQHIVKHYGKLEEFVTLVTEIVPEVLDSRQRTNLLLGLTARMVLELFRTENTADVATVQSHLDKIHTLIECTVEEESNDELDKTVSNFPDLVQSLLEDPSERKHFFQEVFPVHYGPRYDRALQTLVWEFLSRLEELLPVPDFTQTAAWLGSASSVLEECENTLFDPEAIKTLLQHQHHHHHGNLKKNYFPNSTADTILCTLSIPPTISVVIDSEQKDSLDQTTSVEERGQPNGGRYEMDVVEQGQKEGSSHRNEELGTENPLPTSSSQKISCASVRSYKCTYCGKVFPDFNILHEHIVTHKLSFHCHECKKRYSSANQLKMHEVIHAGEMPFKCSQCERQFKHKVALRNHVSTHTSHAYCCTVCGKMVTNLRKHMQVHTREIKYVCNVCGKTLLSSAGLKIHTRFHTGEYPYICDYCGKGYTSLNALKCHIPSHTGELPFSCNLCSKRFLTAYNVKTHQLTHIGKRSYRCFKCGKSFVLKKHLKAHVKNH